MIDDETGPYVPPPHVACAAFVLLARPYAEAPFRPTKRATIPLDYDADGLTGLGEVLLAVVLRQESGGLPILLTVHWIQANIRLLTDAELDSLTDRVGDPEIGWQSIDLQIGQEETLSPLPHLTLRMRCAPTETEAEAWCDGLGATEDMDVPVMFKVSDADPAENPGEW